MGKIALVHDFLFTYGGAERVLHALHQMYPEAPIYTLLAEPEIVAAHFPKATVYTSSLQRSPLRSKPAWLVAAMPKAIEEFDLSAFDTVISSSGAFSHGIITGPHTRHISYCHSPMRYVWDWHAEYIAEKGMSTPFRKFLAEQVLSKLRIWDYVASKRVDMWIANSSVVQQRIRKFYGQESQIIHPPVDTDFFDPEKAVSDTKERHVITASRLSSYKKIDQMIEACSACDIPLKIIGSGTERQRLENLAVSRKAQVTFLGSTSEEEKRNLIAGSNCFLFAAEDDFGIAPVEALSLGIPVLAYGRGGAVEYVINGVNGYLYNEQTSRALTESLSLFLEKGVQSSSNEIRESALRFSLRNFQKAIAKVVANG
jgi:glycosyltransferase involved in cell wall biosynthesis